MRALAALAIAVTAAVFTACGGSDGPEAGPAVQETPTATPLPTPTATPISPAAVLGRSGKVMEQTATFHFVLEHESGSTELIPGLRIEEIEGDVVRPDGLSVSLTGRFRGFAVKASVIALGESTYMTNPLTGEWESLPSKVSPLGFFDPAEGISAMMARIDVTGVAHVVDSSTFQVRGSLPAEALGPLLGVTLADTDVAVDLTIDLERGHLLEARVKGPVAPTDPLGIVRVITLSGFDEAIIIRPPEG